MQEERSLYTAMVDEAKSDRLLQQESHCGLCRRRGHSTQPWWTRQRVTASCSRSHTADCAGGRSLYTAMVDEAKSDRLLQQESHCGLCRRRGHSTQPWWTRQRVTASCSRSHTADCAGGEVTLHSHGGRGKE